jgi:hypothetical protein
VGRQTHHGSSIGRSRPIARTRGANSATSSSDATTRSAIRNWFIHMEQMQMYVRVGSRLFWVTHRSSALSTLAYLYLRDLRVLAPQKRACEGLRSLRGR